MRPSILTVHSHPQGCLDPLSQCLHLLNSAPCHNWSQAIPPAATLVAPVHPGFAPPFAGPSQYDRNALSHVPFITPYQVQVINEYGCSLCAKMENLYSENATYTWLLDAHQHYVPSNYIFFAQYLAYNGPLIPGVFLVNNQPIPPSWTMYPAEISHPFRDVHHTLIQSYRSIGKVVPRGGGPDVFLSAGRYSAAANHYTGAHFF